MTPYLQVKNKSGDGGFLIRNHGGQKKVAWQFSKFWKKRTVNPEFYREDIFFRNEEEIKILSKKMNKWGTIKEMTICYKQT